MFYSLRVLDVFGRFRAIPGSFSYAVVRSLYNREHFKHIYRKDSGGAVLRLLKVSAAWVLILIQSELFRIVIIV